MTESPTPVSGDAMELVERLREAARNRPNGDRPRTPAHTIEWEAADEIERLRSQGGAPDEFVLFPREPSEAILDALFGPAPMGGHHPARVACYRDAISAVQPPVSQSGSVTLPIVRIAAIGDLTVRILQEATNQGTPTFFLTPDGRFRFCNPHLITPSHERIDWRDAVQPPEVGTGWRAVASATPGKRGQSIDDETKAWAAEQAKIVEAGLAGKVAPLSELKEKISALPRKDVEGAAYRVGDRVEKYTGEAMYVGTVVSVYLTVRGKLRYVVDVEPQHFQMISNEAQLRPAIQSDADEMIDQLNVLCEDFGCEAGTNRLHWLHEQLSCLKDLSAPQPPEGGTGWPVLPCRFSARGCQDHAVGIFHVPQGCHCWLDPIQALCAQHACKADSPGPIECVIDFSMPSPPGQDDSREDAKS